MSAPEITNPPRYLVELFNSGWGDDRTTKMPIRLQEIEDMGYEIISVSNRGNNCNCLITARRKS